MKHSFRNLALLLALLTTVLLVADGVFGKPSKKKKLADALGASSNPPAAENHGPTPSLSTSRDPLPVAALVDRVIDSAIQAAHVQPAATASDAEFLRRASVDITGTIPSLDRTMAFLADSNPDKRRQLIDELLASSAYGEHFGNIWYDLLVVRNDDNTKVISRTFEHWLAAEFNSNHGWDRTVESMLTAEGRVDENPATVFTFAHSVTNAAAGEVKVKPQEMLGAVAQRFLGTQIQCAECHNHPFTSFAQTEFWSAAAFFGQLQLKNAEKKQLKSGTTPPSLHEKSPGDGSIEIAESGGKRVTTKFPGGDSYKPEGQRLRTAFADWCTSNQKETLARTSANRMWSHFFARGFVNPIDDIRPDNEASHPEALKALTDELIAADFDLKHLIRCICNTQAYQRASDVGSEKEPENAEKLFARMPLKSMSARTMLASLAEATGHELLSGGKKDGAGGKKKPASPQQRFIDDFTTSEEPDVAEYSHGIPQVLQLMNSGLMSAQAPTLKTLTASSKDPKKVIGGLYLACLTRPATPAEMQKMTQFVAKSANRDHAYADVMWVLLNSGEFVLNH